MAGGAKGVQAVIKETQPLALYVHCGPHCLKLVTHTAKNHNLTKLICLFSSEITLSLLKQDNFHPTSKKNSMSLS